MQVLTYQGLPMEEARFSIQYAVGENGEFGGPADWILILCEALLESI
jgi:hypothetical protein